MNAFQRLSQGRHHDPFEFLGQHPDPLAPGSWQLRIWAPGCSSVRLLPGEGRPEAIELREWAPGQFQAGLKAPVDPANSLFEYVIDSEQRWTARSPYLFPPVLGELDLHLIGEGRHLKLWEALGAHCIEHAGIKGVHFAVWAPNASRVSVVGDFNTWDGLRHPCRSLGSCGIWELFVPGLQEGNLYRFEIRDQQGRIHVKSDPLARAAELRPGSASMVAATGGYEWGDGNWLAARRKRDPLDGPITIYEVHLGSWMKPWSGDPPFHDYSELAERLADYVEKLGFTHVELLPVMEHPLDASWGYQVSGYFAPTRRYGDPDGLRRFVDHLHQRGIGVILDWVPAHFPRDTHALARFDGSALYEHDDPRLGEHPDWGTLIFNYSRVEVRNFLYANALYWIEEFHVDGLRVDAVASMLYLDYSRKEGEWLPNEHGGRENLEALDFLRNLNTLLFERHPGILSIAEESTAWPMVSRPVYLGGLGFNLKWNMGWMNDTLRYFELDPVHRRFHHDLMSFSLVYAWHENFVLVLSHDEVVHGKGSLLDKMPGDDWQKFANLRLLLGWMWCHPGRKMLFMGGELAQRWEWSEIGDVDWRALESVRHSGVQNLVRELNQLLRHEPALTRLDFSPEGFRWLRVDDAYNSVFSFLRLSGDPGDELVVVANCTPVPRHDYFLGVPQPGWYREIFNTDAECYAGSNLGNRGGCHSEDLSCDGYPQRLRLILPPLALLVFKREG